MTLKKIKKIILLVLMVSGLLLSISNFFTIKVSANQSAKGDWSYNGSGAKECSPPGSNCDSNN